jgi:hypothetical protein
MHQIQTNENLYLRFAHHYANEFGWVVIPVTGKTPKGKWKCYQDSAPTTKQRAGMFTVKGLTGLAVVTGAISNDLRVRDFDRVDAYERWSVLQRELAAALPTVRTRRGYHVYFRAKLQDHVENYDDGELRAGKGIVVLPPSDHPEGGKYQWIQEPHREIPLVNDVVSAGLCSAIPAVSESQLPPEIADAIKKTLPRVCGERNRRIWDFVRRLKGVPGLDVTESALAHYIAAWHEQALPIIGTKEFATSEVDLFNAWRNVRTPLIGENSGRVRERSLDGTDPNWFENWTFSRFGKRLMRVCLILQQDAGEASFFLSARKAAEFIAISDQNAAHKLLNDLVRDGKLQLVKKGELKGRMASEWRVSPDVMSLG